MLDFAASILQKVSFDRYLFGKELRKLIMWIGDDEKEISNLQEWCTKNYSNNYSDILSTEFEKNRKSYC